MSNATVAGSWHESLTSTGSGRKSTVDLYILQNGTTLSSSRVALGATCSSNGTMSGSVSGDDVAMTITGINGDTINVTGTVSENSSSMSGSYTIKTSGCDLSDDMGTLSATLIPPVQSSSWSGTITSTRYPPNTDTFTANIREDNSGGLSGKLSFTGPYCSSVLTPSVSISGSQTGALIGFSDTEADGIGIFGAINASAKSISGLYGVSDCSGDNGTFTMNRP